MRSSWRKPAVDLVILDLMLPGEDGLTLGAGAARGIECRHHHPDRPRRDVDRIIGLEMGADDYLPKPFHLRELLARVKSVLRRVSAAARKSPRRSALEGALRRLEPRPLDAASCFRRRGSEVRLTTGEFDLLAAFVNNANQVLSRDRLLDLARNREAGPFDRTIDVQVGRLRRKLEDDPQRPTMIKTVRGTGYIFTPPVEVN